MVLSLTAYFTMRAVFFSRFLLFVYLHRRSAMRVAEGRNLAQMNNQKHRFPSTHPLPHKSPEGRT